MYNSQSVRPTKSGGDKRDNIKVPPVKGLGSSGAGCNFLYGINEG